MDNMTMRQRSLTMSKIRAKETTPEYKLRVALFKLGYRYRKNVAQLPGKPDIVMKKYRSVIFVNGCFWHQHKGCIKANMPRTNLVYWEDKLNKNVSRDIANLCALTEMGWRVLTVWECELNNNLDTTLANVIKFIKSEIVTN